MPKVISNTIPIISLLKIGQLHLLQRIYGNLIVPAAVFAEVEQGKDKPYFIDILKQAWISVEKVSDRKVLPPIHVLEAGEAEVIMLAAERKADLVLIDEALGRKFAKQANLKVTGTIGVLVKAKELGLLEKVVPLLEEMQQKGIWISKSLKEKITALVGE